MLYFVKVCQEYQDYSHLDVWVGKSKQHLLLLYGPVHRTIKMQNVLFFFFFFLMNNQSQRNHRREKTDFKPNHKIISKLIRSYKCRKGNFIAAFLAPGKSDWRDAAYAQPSHILLPIPAHSLFHCVFH